MRGFGSSGVLEVVEDRRGDTYRAVYTVQYSSRVFVLHVFQKKSKSGIATPKPDLDLIRNRLKVAAKRAKGLPTVPVPLSVELATNPYLRAHLPALKTAVGLPDSDDVTVFAEIRARKDKF